MKTKKEEEEEGEEEQEEGEEEGEEEGGKRKKREKKEGQEEDEEKRKKEKREEKTKKMNDVFLLPCIRVFDQENNTHCYLFRFPSIAFCIHPLRYSTHPVFISLSLG